MATTPRPIALAGIGKIARDAHIPTLNDSADWELAATISRNAGVEGVEGHEDIDSFLDAHTDIDTVALALPPGPRYDYAVRAIRAGRNVMLEKPPGRTLSECHALVELAGEAGVSLYASWHSRMGRAVSEAGERLRGATIRRVEIDWREDVRESHPGQDWIWSPGSLGVFDPGINAMSILVLALEAPVYLREATLAYPENRATPITADLVFGHPDGAEITGRLDFRHEGEPVWDIAIDSDRGRLVIGKSGAALSVDDEPIDVGKNHVEYPAVYARFAELVRAGESEVDLRPMRHVADAFLIGRHERTEPFHWDRD